MCIKQDGGDMGIPVKLEVFEGPLDLLLHLIDKNKIDIYDIPIVEITNQYMEYIRNMPREDLNIMSEFLVMAATLLDIKCKMLLPKEINDDGEEEDPRKELVEQLLQYKMYTYMAEELKDRQVEAQCVFYKKSTVPLQVQEYEEPVDLDMLLQDLTLQKLHRVFQDVLRRQDEKIDPVRSKFGKIEKEEVTLNDKLAYIKDYIEKHRKFSFRQLLEKQRSRMQTVVTFLAVLELMKMGTIHVEQSDICGEIMIERNV
nr:segregation/condensation protein A [Mediterraneibacter massiliensis]